VFEVQTAQAWYTTARILLPNLGVGLLETGNRLSGMPLPQAMLRASWLRGLAACAMYATGYVSIS
jgi:hypothetical protein